MTPGQKAGATGTGFLDVVPVFQPIVDLRDGTVVGYEALARGADGTPPEELFAAAREAGRLAELDRACRDAALRAAAAAGLDAPFALFVNGDAGALEDALPDTPLGAATVVMEITQRALTERPEAVLRTLTALRTRGWGVSLDDVGADSRSLALMPLLYPDVIKLDLRLLDERAATDLARVVTAVGAEAEQRRATVLAEGIDSEANLAMARAAGATLGQGYLLGEPAALPDPLPHPGRPLRLADSGGAPGGPPPFERVTNWRRPQQGSLELAERTAALLTDQAAALGETGMVLATVPSEIVDGRHAALAAGLGFVGLTVAEPGEWTEVALGPGYAACFVARRGADDWRFATSYDRELVVECALQLMAQLPPAPPPR